MLINYGILHFSSGFIKCNRSILEHNPYIPFWFWFLFPAALVLDFGGEVYFIYQRESWRERERERER